MAKFLFYFIALLAGILAAIQSGVNAQLRAALGQPILAALFSFAIGTSLLLLYGIYVFFADRAALLPLSALSQIAWWKWTGGILGAGYVVGVIFAAPQLGAASTMGLIITGQLLGGLLLDHFGLVGFREHSINLWRVAGAVLLVAGVIMISRN